MTPEAYERRPEVKAALKLVRSRPELLRTSGWASYANRLMEALGVPPGARTYEAGWEMPLEYQYAYKRAVAGWTKKDAFQVVAQAIKRRGTQLSGAFPGQPESSGITLFRDDLVDVTPLLEAFREIAKRNPGVMLLGKEDPPESLSVEEHVGRLEEYLREEAGEAEELEWLKSPVFIWGYDRMGFIHIFGTVPEASSLMELFSESTEEGLPTGRPQMPPGY